MMISALRRSLLTLALCLPCLSTALAVDAPPTAAEARIEAAALAAQAAVQMGPREIELGDQGVLKLPEGFGFIPKAEAQALMEAQGKEEEEAAVVLGARGWQTFWHVTLPNVKWGLLYGVILCNARAMGEFGAVSVVSGHIRGQTNTMPLHVEILYNEYQFAAAFAVASLLALLALVTLVIKVWVERQAGKAASSEDE